MSDLQACATLPVGLADLDQTFRADLTGDVARSIHLYFGAAARAAEGWLECATGTDRAMAATLLAGFRAAQRLVVQIWQDAHGCVLVA